jgi:hypothetical protein
MQFKETIAVSSEYHMKHKDVLWVKFRVLSVKEGDIYIVTCPRFRD